MFYSHEILTSQQYGVATVWLVSTIGLRSANRKISRKAIENVNVLKACETIQQPGAPIALRLQGTLLFGVSRVFSQQCNYVLNDAEKVQTNIRAFHSTVGGSEFALDPNAGKARRDQLMLQDDPGFDLDMRLPAFVLDDGQDLLDPRGLQASQKTSSQLSPLQRESFSMGAVSRDSFFGNLELPQSSPAGGSSQLRSPLRLEDSQYDKADDGLMNFHDEQEHLHDFDDWGIEIDADGNLITLAEEPELPILPRPTPDQAAPNSQESELNIPLSDDQGDIIMGTDDNILPQPEPLPQNQQEQPVEEIVNAEEFTMPARQRRPRARAQLAPDQDTTIPRREVTGWSKNYLANVEQARKRHTKTTVVEAQKNAFHFVFGRGIANVGHPTGIPDFPNNPLANYFAGVNLGARLFGLDLGNNDEVEETPRGRRRKALEALELEEHEHGRRVRRRLSEQVEQRQGQGSALPQSQASNHVLREEEREIGRDAGPALPDLPSDVPWNRGSSQVPGSSVKGSATAEHYRGQSRQVSASPLHGRGTRLPSDNIERFSDQPIFHSDGDFPLSMRSGDNSMFSDPIQGIEDAAPQDEATGNTSQMMRDALDREGHNFLGYVKEIAKEKEPDQHQDQNGRAWVDFDDLFKGEDNNRVVAVQAFYHVLALATKNAIKVKQECVNMHPFGKISVGVELATEGIDA